MYLVCGEALVDLFVDASAGTTVEMPVRAVAGGSPFNVAIGLARLDTPAAFGSDIADDGFGDLLAATLAEAGVDPGLLHRTAPWSSLAVVSLDQADAPRYAFHGLDRSDFHPEPAALAARRGEISGLHLASIALVLPRSAGRLVALARDFAGKVPVSLDPNIRLSIEPDVAKWRGAIDAIRPFADILKISEEDIQALYGPSVDVEGRCEAWLDGATRLVILTRGEAGAVVFSKTAGRIPVAPVRVDLVDAVGAGDSFMAGFLSELARCGGIAAIGDGDVLRRVGRFAATAAALTCAARGPKLPTRSEVEAASAEG